MVLRGQVRTKERQVVYWKGLSCAFLSSSHVTLGSHELVQGRDVLQFHKPTDSFVFWLKLLAPFRSHPSQDERSSYFYSGKGCGETKAGKEGQRSCRN